MRRFSFVAGLVGVAALLAMLPAFAQDEPTHGEEAKQATTAVTGAAKSLLDRVAGWP